MTLDSYGSCMRYLNRNRIILTALVTLALVNAPAHGRNLLDALLAPATHTQRDGLSPFDAVALYSTKQKTASFDACADQFPGHRPLDINLVPAHMRPTPLCSDHFAVLYSQTSKTPLVVIERLTAAQLQDAGDETRTNQFFADPRLPRDSRAELSDYRGQIPAVDRGHLAPAADAPSARAMAQSFALSNMVPQSPESNRKAWSDIEKATRKFVRRAQGNVFVFTGPIFDIGHGTIGQNKVWKPTRLFKLVYDEATDRAWAYILPNAISHVVRPVDYSTFVQETGLRVLR